MNDTLPPKYLTFPAGDDQIDALSTGDIVLISGTILTARDRAHKWLFDRFITKSVMPTNEDFQVYAELQKDLYHGCIYHCGPVVSGDERDGYTFISAGPTTSMREELYQPAIIDHFHLKGVIGKGGMGAGTQSALQREGAIYMHAVGGAAVVIAESVKEVLKVYKLEFGNPEAMWLIRVEDFPVIVTMDAHGISLHEQLFNQSRQKLEHLLSENRKDS